MLKKKKKDAGIIFIYSAMLKLINSASLMLPM